MSARWRVLDCSLMEGVIRSRRGAISIERQDSEPVEVPVADIAVVLIGQKVGISGAVMHRLLSNDIAVIVCDWKGVPEGAAYSWSEHGRVGARTRAQADLSLPRQKNAWGRIVKAKVLGQAAVLAEHGRNGHEYLLNVAKRVRSGDPDNLEGMAARHYWQCLWGDEGFRRHPGLGDSTRNQQLDYAYTVLRGHGIRAVLAAGLTPAIGVFHRNRSNNFSLVDDLIEPFRPAVDSAVAELSPDVDMNDSNTRAHLVKASSRAFSPEGYSVASVFEDFAKHFARYVEGDEAKLAVPVWNGA